MTPESSPPPAMHWTANQLRAIEDRGCDLVVSASAGSGKTAVLTERVLRLLTEPAGEDGQPAARIEELLIITFTEKAARQMRERIEKRIHKALEANPESHPLRAAYDGLACAWIMTIDAFCRRLVIEHFHEAGVSPAPRIPDAAELAELERTVLGQVLEEWAGDPARRAALGELIGACARGVDGLSADVRRLIGFLQSLDRPEAWLDDVHTALAGAEAAADCAGLPEAAAAAASFKNAAGELAGALAELAALAVARGGEPARTAQWRQLAGQLATLAGDGAPFHPDTLRAWLEENADAVLAKLDLKKNCGEVLYRDEEFRDNFLKRFKKHYERWRSFWFTLDEAGLLYGARLAAAQSRILLALAQEALERIGRVKQRRGLLTFNDFERLALKILSDPARPDAPSEIAWRLRRQFKFVLVDEYQDTSPLQDALVRRVARSDDPAQEPNLFLVGDVKQSIYRFRHAEPELFLGKMRAAERAAGDRLRRINLHENFRSRPAILEFINACFEGIMDRTVGELDYRGEERLRPGRVEPAGVGSVAVEAQWLPKNGKAAEAEDTETAENEPPGEEGNKSEAGETLEGIAIQAHWVACRIRELTGPESGILIPEEAPPDTAEPPLRRAQPGDCAILLRGLRGELEVWTQALEREGLKVRAPGINPLFSTSEMLDLLAALRIADQPFQDIPLATLMRSPLGGFSDDELLALRMARRHGPFYAAVWECAGRPLPEPGPPAEGSAPPPAEPLPPGLRRKVEAFVARIDGWRCHARRAPADELLGLILRETGYEAFLMGHLDGLARIEHLDFLRGLLLRLSRGAEGANPLATFLELIERAAAEEGEVGELPESVAGHQEAVSLLTIHRAKGLEFPIVFLPRLERSFRVRRLAETLFDRELGLSRPGVDVARRRRFPTLAQRATIDRLLRKDRSEEIRLLYVAMTRARERLVLVGQPGNLEQLDRRWGTVMALEGRPTGVLDRLHARCPADLVGPIVQWLARGENKAWLQAGTVAELAARGGADPWTRARDALARLQSAPAATPPPDGSAPEAAPLVFLPALDPGAALTGVPAKTSVTRLKQQREAHFSGAGELEREEDRFLEDELRRPFFTRQGRLSERKPAWLEDGTATPARLSADRRGTLTHALLAHLDLAGALDADGLRAQAGRLVAAGLVGGPFEAPELILESLDFADLAWFFTTDLGRRLAAQPGRVTRELAFTAHKDIVDFAPEAKAAFPTEKILVQGVIDAVIDEGAAATVIDYKTDHVRNREHWTELMDRYTFQVRQYARALRAIWQLKSVSPALVFLDARRVEWVPDD